MGDSIADGEDNDDTTEHTSEAAAWLDGAAVLSRLLCFFASAGD